MSKEETRNPGVYFNIIDGSFRTRVESTHPQAVAREYETRSGAKAIKYERHVSSLTGYIEDIGIYDSEFGKQLKIKLDPNEDGKAPVIEVGIETSFGEDILKRLPHVNFRKEVRFAPFAFEKDGRPVRGVTLSHGEEKLINYFYDPETKQELHGFPVPEGDKSTYETEDWKIFYLRVRKFLLAYFAEKIMPRFNEEKNLPRIYHLEGTEDLTKTEAEDVFGPVKEYPEEVINPDDIPF